MNIIDKINQYIDQIEGSIINLVSAIAPWFAPVAPAYMAYKGMRDVIIWPPLVAGLIAAVIEMLGLATITTTLTFWRHNRQREFRAQGRQLPTWIPIVVFAFYLFVVLTVNVVMDVEQFEYRILLAKFLLSLLSVPAAVILGVRALHTNVVNDARAVKTVKKQRKKLPNDDVKNDAADTPKPQVAGGKKLSRNARRKQVESVYLGSGGDFSPTELARSLGVTRQTIYNDLDAMGLSNGR